MAAGAVGQRSGRRRAWRDALTGYLFVSPAMAIFLLFLAFPVAFAVWLSLRQWNGFTPLDQAPFIGLANFVALATDRIFRQALRNTALFAVASTALQMAVAFVLAFTLWFYRLRFSTFLRALFFFPTVISMVFVGLTWQQLLASDGPVDQLLARCSATRHVSWLPMPDLVLWVVVWVVELAMVRLDHGAVPRRHDGPGPSEADRGGPYRRRRHLRHRHPRRHSDAAATSSRSPCCSTWSAASRCSIPIYVLTGGGPTTPPRSSAPTPTGRPSRPMDPGQLGYASAISVVMTVILFGFAYFRVRMSRLV